MNKKKRIGRKMLCLIIAFVMVITLVPHMPANLAYADAGDVPDHNKTRVPNGDGTYKLSLDVTGDADTETTDAKANILVVMDVSGSMTNGNNSIVYTYTETTGTSGTQYGYYNGRYVELTYYQGTWYRENRYGGYSPYNGTRYLRNRTRRADAAEKVVYDFADALYDYNKTTGADNVQMALVAFSSGRTGGNYNNNGTESSNNPGNGNTAAWLVQNWTNSENTFLGNLSSTGTEGSRKLKYGGGTNWEAAMQRALSVLGTADGDPTYVVFVTDGKPTFYVSGGDGSTTTWREYRGPEEEVLNIENYNTADHSYTNPANNNTTLYGIYAYGNEADYLDDLIYYSQNGERRPGGEDADTEPTDNYYNASDEAALRQAINDIFAAIVETLGVGSVAITDGTTTNVQTNQGVSHLLAVEPNTYDYWLTIPVSGNGPYTMTRVDFVSGDPYTITLTEAEDGSYTVTWEDSSGSHEVEGLEGSVSLGKFKYHWTEANDFYKYAPPEANYDNSESAVKWDLSSVGTLLDQVTYTVTFNVYPTQETYDMIADLENGELEYDELDPAIKQYLKQETDGSYTLETNTTTELAYVDSRVSDEVQHESFENPPRVATAVQKMDITKRWFNDIDWRGQEQYADGFNMDVTRDGTVFDSVTVKPDDWSDQIYISTGLMRVQRDENNNITGIEVLDNGHDYTLKEPANMTYYWELVIETLHPMLVNGELHSLVEVKEADIPEGMGDADFYTLEGVDFYRIGDKVFEDNGPNDEDTASVSAYNERKSNLNVTKTITGNADVAPEDAEFAYTMTVTSKDGSDVWFSVQDEDENYVSDDASITGATAEVKDGARTGYYYAPSGTQITFKLKAGWNLRFINLPTYSTYTVEESNTMDPGFTFDNVDGTTEFKVGGLPDGAVDIGNNQFSYDGVIYTKVSDTEYTAVYNPTINGRKVEGKIVSANAPYQVTFANKYTPTKVTPSVTKAVSGKDAEEAFTFSIEAGDATTTRAITAGDVVMPDPATATTEEGIEDGGNGTATFGDIVFNRVGTYTFTVKETNSNPPAGWTYANTDVDAKTITVVVTSGENGLVAEVTGNNPTFTNSYDETTAAPSVTKKVEGWDATEQFTFSIALKSGEAANVKMPDATTVTTKTEGNIKKDDTEKLTFGDITFYAEGTYVFTIDETTTTTARGWTYDASTKDVTVVVSKDNNGKLVATIQNDNPTFTNSYDAEPVEAQIPVIKNVIPKGSSTTDIEGKFTFTLAAVTEGAPMPTPATITSGKDGVQVLFGKIEFTEPGTYEYTVTESITDGGTDVNGITLETSAPRSVSITIKDDGSGILKVDTNNGVVFNNPYKAKSLDIVIPVKKTLEVPEGLIGPDITEGYTFTIADDPSDSVSSPLPETKTLKNPGPKGGEMSFGGEATGKITVTEPGTYKYIITESGTFAGVANDADATSGKVVTVVVTDNKDGTMSYTINDAEDTTDDTTEFVNVYDAQPVTASFPVQKVLTIPEDAEDAPTEWSYTINVAGTPAAASMTGTVSNTNDTAEFGPFTFNAPGTYTYTVTESGEVEGVVNDANATTGKTVTIVVEDGKEGRLVIKSISSTTDSPLQFTNTYHETGITIPVTKQLKKIPETLEGPDITGKYTFTITGSTGAPLPETKEIKNKGGAMQFGPIIFNKEGTFTYTVTESGEVDGVTNDSAKTVTVTVTRGEDGELHAELGEVKSFDFINTYEVEPITASFPVKKMISKPEDAVGPADWKYTIDVASVDGAPEAKTMTGEVTKAAPTTTFGPFTYTEPGTYEYTVTESGEVDGVTNEQGSKTVTVTVVDNKDGTLTATADSTTENTLTFTNSYNYEGTEAVLQVKKTLEVPEGLKGPEDISNKFTFTLSAVTENAPMPASNTVQNPDPDGGLAAFGAIPYSKPGKYTYKIVESAGNVPGVTNDTSEQTVTVTIVDGSDGNLKVDSIVYSNKKANAEFVNTYNVEPTTAKFPVKKVVSVPEGLDGPKDWKYTIDVTAKDGAPEAKTMTGEVTKAEPTVTFGDFTYTEPGTYVYEVTETGENSGITNDTEAVKTVTVTVKDKGDGTLEATATSTTEKPATFTNTYHVEPTTASFPVKKFVEVPEGLDGPEKWSYKINVASNNGAPVAETMEGTVTNENDTADFGPFTYNKPGTYTYTVSETGTVAGVTNDPDAAGKTVTVTVTDKGDGTLEAKADSTTEKPLTFTNKYSTEPVQTTAELFKKVASMPPNTTSATFKFTLEETTEGVEADPLSGTVTATAATPAGEKGYAIDFGPLTFTEPGTHTYTLTEVIDDDLDGGWVVSGSPAENVKIVVSDNGEGKLVAEVTGATITNTFDTVSVPGQKTWNDKDYLEYEGYERPESITVNLLADGKKIDSVVVTPDEEGNWTFEFKDLPKYKNHGTEIVYSVEEEPVAGFEASTGELTYEIVNTPNRDDEDELNPTTIHLKKVDYLTPADEDGNKVGLAGAEFTLTSDKLDEPVVYTTNEDGMVDITFDVNGEYTLTETKAPEGYQLPADPALSYTIKVDKEFIKSVKLNKEKNVWTWIYDLIAGITADYDRETHTLTVSDTPIKTKITADKVWEDANNQDGKRPETLTYTLTGMAGDVEAYTNTQTVKVAADGTASYTWEDLATYYDGVPVEYAVTEADVDGYKAGVGDIVPNEDGTEYTVEITNTHKIDLTTVTVNKAWSDQDNKFKTRPEKVTVQLMADGKAYGEPVELTEADKWTYTWTELPANQEGKVAVPVEYTVKEVKEAGYTASYELSGDAEKGYTVAMTNTLEKYPVTVTKAFTGITEAKIPEDFVVTVTYAGTTVRLNTKTQGVVKSEDGLTYTWTIEDIPYGAEVSVAEENADVLGYIVTAGIPEAIKVTDDAAKNVLSITNKYEENFGNLEITKSVPQFNAASGKQTFVFSIVAELEGDKVYDGVETIDFTQAGTKTVKIEGKIPVGSKVTVTEVYSGASYELTVKDPQTTEIIPTAEGTAKVSFENKPDGEITTGYGVLNEYDYTGAEGWVHNKNKTDSAE